MGLLKLISNLNYRVEFFKYVAHFFVLWALCCYFIIVFAMLSF